MAEHPPSAAAAANSGENRPPAQRLGILIFLSAMALFLLVVFFDPITLVSLMFIAAAAIASLLRPIARLFTKRSALAGTIVGIVFWLTVIGLLVGLGFALEEAIREQLRQLPQIEQQLDQVLFTIGQHVGLDDPPTLRELGEPLINWLIGGLGENGQLLAVIVDGIGVVIVSVALLVFGSAFLLSESSGRIPNELARFLPEYHREPFQQALRDIELRFRWWLLGILVSMSVVGVGAFIGFTLIGLEMALPLAMLAGFAEIVPILGPTFAFLVIVLFAAAQGPTEMAGVLVVWGIIQVLEPYVLVPMVMRQAVRIPPLVTLFTVVLWARLLGPLGLILAIPINIIIWTALQHFYLRYRSPPEGFQASGEAR